MIVRERRADAQDISIDELVRDTLRVTGRRTKREAVEQSPRTLSRLSKQSEIRRLRGKLNRQGDIDTMRNDR
ncbi:MAG TPA: hypothetical protein VNX70_14680 [Bryobacteraceae bacterium]|nr:hypothetical protein [Bryobacteraceae bacterium]